MFSLPSCQRLVSSSIRASTSCSSDSFENHSLKCSKLLNAGKSDIKLFFDRISADLCRAQQLFVNNYCTCTCTYMDIAVLEILRNHESRPLFEKSDVVRSNVLKSCYYTSKSLLRYVDIVNLLLNLNTCTTV